MDSMAAWDPIELPDLELCPHPPVPPFDTEEDQVEELEPGELDESS